MTVLREKVLSLSGIHKFTKPKTKGLHVTRTTFKKPLCNDLCGGGLY